MPMPTAILTRPETTSLDQLAAALTIESLTIGRDVMPRHYSARAVILDLQPDDVVPAIVAVEAAIRAQYADAIRCGWSATSDGLKLWFWSAAGVRA